MIPPEKVPFSLSDDQLDGLYGDRLDRLRAAIESGDRQRLIDTHYELFQEPAPGFANGNGNGHHNGVVVVPDPREVQLPPAASTPDRYADRFFELDAIERLLAEPPKPKRWRVHGFAIDATLTLLSGEAGAGKSILMDNLCSGVAHGRTVAGMPCVKGTALYVDGEMGVEMFFDRYRDTGRTRADFRYVDALGWTCRSRSRTTSAGCATRSTRPARSSS
jgi:AAA domain